MKNSLAQELARRAVNGQYPISFRAISKKLKSIGYKLDRPMDCKSIAMYLTGDFSGCSYPCCTTGIKEIDTGVSAFHFSARRDENFASLQKWRFSGDYFAVTKDGFIFEI